MLRTATADTITAEVVLADGALHVSGPDLDFIRQQILDAFGLLPADVEVIVVGSAKLGFSLVEKDRPVYKPRYRSFDVESDIDIAVISSKLYSTCWRELSNFSHAQAFFPWNAGSLSDYMLVGWLRPDKAPRIGVTWVDRWWRLFGDLSNTTRFKRRRVRGGLYYAKSFLHDYHRRAVSECATLENV